MTTPDLAAIEARTKAATQGPWLPSVGSTADGAELVTTKAQKADFLALSLNNDTATLWLVVSDEVIPAATGDGPRAEANAKFIAHARADIPALLALVREQQAALARVEGLADTWWADFPSKARAIHLAIGDVPGGERGKSRAMRAMSDVPNLSLAAANPNRAAAEADLNKALEAHK